MLVEDLFAEAQGAGGGLDVLVRRDVFQCTLEAELKRGLEHDALAVALRPDIGEVLVQQPGAPIGELTSAGFIGSTTSQLDQLTKSLDGQIRKADGTVPDPDQTGKFGQGFLESSNVNAIEELVKNLDMQRQFEINVKLIKKASDIDSAGTKLMSLPT